MANIIVTGGSGMAGKWVVRHLAAQGHKVLNVDVVAHPEIPARTLITDLTDSGQVFNALTSTTSLGEFKGDSIKPEPIDAVIHFAAIPRIMVKPDNETFRINTMSTYNVLDACSKLGIKKVIIASSETTYGLVFSEFDRDPEYLPLDEEYPVSPMDSYAMSKICNEKCAQAFQLRNNADIYCFRIGNVIEPGGYAKFPEFFANPELRKRITWSYIDARDLAQAVSRAIEVNGLGFQIFNVGADDVSSDMPTAELLARYYPNVPVRKQFGLFEALFSNEKIKRLLGFKQEFAWRDMLG
jgi:nucleoside-diphosphate-sugar epimerase